MTSTRFPWTGRRLMEARCLTTCSDGYMSSPKPKLTERLIAPNAIIAALAILSCVRVAVSANSGDLDANAMAATDILASLITAGCALSQVWRRAGHRIFTLVCTFVATIPFLLADEAQDVVDWLFIALQFGVALVLLWVELGKPSTRHRRGKRPTV
jgi:hypothetical protein